MITKDNLLKIGLDEAKSAQVLELLGTAAEKLYHEDGYAKAMSDVDRFTLLHFGVTKNADEKSTDYIKRASGEKETKTLQEKEAELAKEILDLKEKLKAKPGDEKLIKELEDLKAEKAKFPDIIDQKTKEWKDKFEKSEKENAVYKKQVLLEKNLPKFKEGLDDEYKNFKVQSVITKILETKEIQTSEDGKILIYDPVTHDRTPVDTYMSKELDSIVFKASSQAGGGAGSQQFASQANGKIKFDEGESENDKYQKIKEYIGTQEGIDKFHKDYSKRLNELCKEHKLDKFVIPEPQK